MNTFVKGFHKIAKKIKLKDAWLEDYWGRRRTAPPVHTGPISTDTANIDSVTQSANSGDE